MLKTRWLTRGALLALAVAFLPALAAPAGAVAYLVDQYGTGASLDPGANSSSIPAATPKAQINEAADDFLLTTTGSNNYYQLTHIDVFGQYFSTPTIASTTIRFYRDNGSNLPGALYTSVTVGGLDASGNLSLDTSVLLPASNAGSRYWMSVQANVTFNSLHSTAFWSWKGSTLPGLGANESAWRSLSNSSVGACIAPNSWQRRVSDCLQPPSGPGVGTQMAFRLVGAELTLANHVYLPRIQR